MGHGKWGQSVDCSTEVICCKPTCLWCCGEFNEGLLAKQHCQQHWFGLIVHAVGEKYYLMQFDNGKEKGLASSVLKVESMVAALPPDPLVPIPQNLREEAVLEAADEMLHEDEELEHLPDSHPEEEEAEQADVEHADTEQANDEIKYLFYIILFTVIDVVISLVFFLFLITLFYCGT